MSRAPTQPPSDRLRCQRMSNDCASPSDDGWRRRIVRIAAIAAACTLLTAMADGPVVADRHPVRSGIVVENPADLTPDVLNGHVNAFAEVGSTMIVGGSFRAVSQGGVTYARRNLFAFNTVTGEVSTTFRPRAFGEVLDLQLSPSKTSVYVVGNFSSIDKQKKTRRAARLLVSDGAVDRRFTSPGFDRAVQDIAVSRGRLYLAGYFTKVGGKRRGYVVALSPKGVDTNRARFSFTGTNRDGRTHVRSMDMSPDGRTMVVVGNFMKVNGKRRPQVAVLNVGKRATTLASWATTRFARHCGPHFDSYMRDVAISPDGSYFVIVTTGGPRGVQSSGLLCDSVTRWNFGTSPGQQPEWINYSGGDTMTSVIVDSKVVYVGGHMRWLNNSFGKNKARAGAVERSGIAALSPVNGLPYTWNPGRPRGYGVTGFALTKSGLWIGHDTQAFGDEPHQRIAFCPNDDVTTLPSYSTARLPGTLTRLGAGLSDVVVASSFDGTASTDAHAVSSDASWQSVRGSFVVDGTLFAGWSDGTLTAQTYDGSTFGPPSDVDLHGAFSDLENVRSMFYDRLAQRLYYTLTGSTKLFYRYFQADGAVVGSWRYVVKATSDVAWDRVSGGFIVKRVLYYVDSPTKSLRRVGWSRSHHRTVGSPTVILGPRHDGVSYRSAAVVLTD
jgi:hypothetical protein